MGIRPHGRADGSPGETTRLVRVGVHPPFEQQDLLVDGGKYTAAHQQLAQVRGGAPGLEVVEHLVCERRGAGGDAA